MRLNLVSMSTFAIIASAALSCAPHNRNTCNTLASEVSAAIHGCSSTPPEMPIWGLLINVPKLETMLSVKVSVTEARQASDRLDYSLHLVRNGRPLASWSPGCASYKWVNGNLLFNLEGQGIQESWLSVYDSTGRLCGLYVGY